MFMIPRDSELEELFDLFEEGYIFTVYIIYIHIYVCKRIFSGKTGPDFQCDAIGLQNIEYESENMLENSLGHFTWHFLKCVCDFYVHLLHLVPSGTCISRFSSPGGESL